MRKSTDYKPLQIDEMTRLFGVCAPEGLAWNNKGNPNSNLYKTLRSLSTAVNKLEEKLYELVTEWDVRVTNELILEWETAVGIPDECRKLAEEISVRRTDVLTKLRKIPIITVADYEALANAVTGVSVDDKELNFVSPEAEWNIGNWNEGVIHNT